MGQQHLWMTVAGLIGSTSCFSAAGVFHPSADFCDGRHTSGEQKETAYCKTTLPESERTFREPPSRLQIGVDYTYVKLRPHGSSSFHGNLGGIQGIYEYRPLDRFYGAAKLAWKEGKTTSGGNDRSLVYVDTQERLGYTFGMCKDSRLSLFSGFGYRYEGQKLRRSSGSKVQFNYSEIYVPVGFTSNFCLNSCFALGLGFTWMPQAFSTVSIVPLKGNHWNLKQTLSNFYVEMPLTYYLTRNKKFSIILNPFYEHWEDGRSTARLASGKKLGLPGNTYNYWGVDLNFGFSF